MKILSGKRKRPYAAITIAFMVILAVLAMPGKAYAEYFGLEWAAWSGARATWASAVNGTESGSVYPCQYDVTICDVSGGQEQAIKQYNGLETTSQDVTDYVLSNNKLGKQLKFKVVAYEGGSGNYGPAESETVVFHKVTFMASGAAWKTGIAYENGTVDRPSTVPESAGNEFVGWYKDPDFNEIWDFRTDKMGSEDTTLYGKFVPAGQHIHDGITYSPWNNDAALPDQAGNYYLVQDVRVNGWNPPGDVNLCLNGHTISSDETAITMDTNATLDICDCSSEHIGMFSGCRDGAIQLTNGTIRLHSGSICGNGHAYVSSTDPDKGAVRQTGGIFEMLGGEISGNHSTDSIGSVDIQRGTFRLRGGLIGDNGETGLSVRDGHLEISGGTISGNECGLYYFANSVVSDFAPIKIVAAQDKDTADDINITGNSENNIYLGPGRNYDFAPIRIETSLTEDTRIGISVRSSFRPGDGEPRTFTSGFNGNADISNFTSDNANYAVETVGSGSSTEAALKLKHSISFDGNSAEGSMDPATVVDGHNYELPGNGFTVPEGYAFGGWLVGSNVRQPGFVLDNVTANYSVKAKWNAIEYGITYDLAGGNLPAGVHNPASYTIASNNFTLAEPERTGYIFTGWTGTGLDVPVKDLTIEKGSTGDRSYTANWELIEYSLTYKLNGGKTQPGEPNPSIYTVESETFTLANPIKEGSIFTGWYLKGSDEEEQQTVTIEKGSTGNRTYIAMWKEAYRVIVTPGNRHGDIALSKTTAEDGDEIEFTLTPEDKYRCLQDDISVTDSAGNALEITKVSDNKYKFTMPAADAFVSAEFTPIPVSGINVHNYSDGITLKEGETTGNYVLANAMPKDALNRELDWQIQDTSIATLDEQHYVHGLKEGGTSLVISATDGSGKKAYIQIYVGHIYSEVEAVAPSCEEAGNIAHYKCDYCGSLFIKQPNGTYKEVSEEEVIDPATDHDYGAWAPVEGEDKHQRICSHDVTHVETAAHNWDDGVITTPPTAGSEGVMTYTCADCGATRTEKISNDLEVARAAALAELGKIDLNAYSEPEKTAVKTALDEARQKINDATSLDEVTSALSTARSSIDAQKTDSQKQEEAEAAADAKAKKVKTVTVNAAKVNAKAIDKAVKKAGGSEKYVTKIVLGKKVKKISAKSFAKYKKVTTLEVKTKKLRAKAVKGCLKGSKVKAIKVKVGSKKVNKTYVRKYKKFFTKKNAGRKAAVKL